MRDTRSRALASFRRLADDVGRSYRMTAQDVDGYRVADLSPGDVEYTDADWNGSDAEASYPNPSAEDTDLDFLADHYLFAPADMSADDPPPKSAFKGPIRMGPGGPVNTNALLANIQAINGARGGFDDVSTDTLRAGFDAAVQHLIAAGEYDDEDDAPDASVEAADAASYGTGDTVRWEDGDADVYGVIRDVATSGDDVFADRIDGDFALSPTEDNPGYLIETLDETDDGWVPSGTMVGHREDTLHDWTPDADVMEARHATQSAQATGRVRFDADVTAGDEDAPLTGIVWGEGDHDLALGGQPTPVHVPKETVRPTFEALREDVDAGDVTLGFDHPGPDSVAAKTGIVNIGVANDVALTDDGSYIALTDSDLTNDQAVQAAQSGDFDDLDWSIVADVAVRRTDGGDVATTDDGRVILDATRITRIDAVDNGAVDAASIERGTADLPDLRDEAQQVAAAAQNPAKRPDAVQALQASATALSQHMGNNGSTFDPDVDADIPQHVREQLNAAAGIIDDQEQELNAAKAKASGFERVLSAHDVDPDEYDDPQAAAQAVIDEQTDDLRREIAELEADLAQFDTDDSQIEARADELAGGDPSDLRNTLNARKATAYDVQSSKASKGRAAAKNDAGGRVDPAGGSGAGGNADADEIAMSAMDGRDRIQAEQRSQSPSEYIADEYDLQASQYDAADELNRDIMDATNGGDGA